MVVQVCVLSKIKNRAMTLSIGYTSFWQWQLLTLKIKKNNNQSIRVKKEKL